MRFLNNSYTKAILPSIISMIVALCGNAIFSLEQTSIKFTIALVILIIGVLTDISLIAYYVHNSKNNVSKLNQLADELASKENQLKAAETERDALRDTIIQLQKCFNDNAEKLYKLIDNARKKREIDLNIWNYQSISDFVCDTVLPYINKIAEKGNSFSVSVIVPQITNKSNRRKTEYFMLSFRGMNKQKPHIYRTPISQNNAYKYYYGKLFKKNNPEIACLMTPEEINSEFYFSDSSSKGKYAQYIGIPICCDGNKMVGLLQIVADEGSIISSNKEKLNDIINNFVACFADFILFSEKIEKGVALDFR